MTTRKPHSAPHPRLLAKFSVSLYNSSMKNVRFESPNIEALQAEGYTCVNMHMHSNFR